MTWRAIHDTVPDSERIASLTSDSERLFWRILCRTDAYGRMRGEARRVWARCVALVEDFDVAKVEDCLGELEGANLLECYDAACGVVLAVLDFDKYQPIDFQRKRGTPRLPAPPEPSPADSATTTALGQSFPALGHPRKEREGERETTLSSLQANATADLNGTAAANKASTSVADDLIAYAARELQHRWKPTGDRRRKINARLREGYSEADLRSVIAGVLADDWSERRKKGNDDPKVIYRDAAQVDRFLELANGSSQGKRPGDAGYQPISAAQRDEHQRLLRAARQNGAT